MTPYKSLPDLEIRLLGELSVLRDGRPVELPPSKKTRALLGYLAATSCEVTRDRLCDLLWDTPDDPRAALRWSLTKIRPILDAPKKERLVADREHVAFEAKGASVDWLEARALEQAGLATSSAADLAAGAARFRGELLEGLSLPDCFGFDEWLRTERAQARRTRVAILDALLSQIRANPAEALPHARARVAIDPLSESAHATVIRLLGELGRADEAEAQYQSCKRLLAAELDAKPSAALETARMSATRSKPAAVSAPVEAAVAARPAAALRALVGRVTERLAIDEYLDVTRTRPPYPVLIFAGEPGIGKSRLLDELAARVAQRREKDRAGLALSGRAFEAERVRPYGPWIDLLRAAPGAASDAELAPFLGAAQPSDAPDRGDRTRLFDSVARFLSRLASAQFVAVLLDDVQWLDDASVALFHYVVRATAQTRIVFAAAARSGELADNAPVLTAMRALSREGRMLRFDLAPLSRQEILELVQDDASGLVEQSGGNPLFALELARARADGRTTTASLDALIGERLERLDDRARELVSWAAALGRRFDPSLLARARGTPAETISTLEVLERDGILRGAEGGTVEFTHDLLRDAAWRRLSGPLQKLVHGQIARSISTIDDPAGALAGDLAHHAALGGEDALAARASLAAGQRALRLAAGAEAVAIARRGLRHTDALPREEALRVRVGLLKLIVHSGSLLPRALDIAADLEKTAQDAKAAGFAEESATAYHALSVLHHDAGSFEGARRNTALAVEAAQSAKRDPAAIARQLAISAACFMQIEREVPRARTLLEDAREIAGDSLDTMVEPNLAFGFAADWDGRPDEALRHLERALALARAEGNQWAASLAGLHMMGLELEQGRPEKTLQRGADLKTELLALGDGGSEGAAATALESLAHLMLREPGSVEGAERGIDRLRALDAKGLLAAALVVRAECDRDAGRLDAARAGAEEALRAAGAVGRRNQVALARALLAGLATNRQAALAALEPLGRDSSSDPTLSMRARTAVSAALQRLDRKESP